MYICIYGEGWGFPGTQLYFIEMDFRNVHFTLVFTVFYGFESICGIIETIGCCADKLRVCPRRKTSFQSFSGMGQNACSIFPMGIMVSCFFVVLWLRQRCHNSLENHGRNDIRTFFIFTSTSINFTLTSSTSINFINVSIIILNVS